MKTNKPCTASKQDGSKCEATALANSDFCFFRDPSRAAELKQTPSECHASGKVVTASLTAKDIVKKAFDCAECLTDHEILQRIRDGLASRSGTHFNWLLVNARLRSSIAGQFLESFWSSFRSLSEADQYEIVIALQSGLKPYAKSRRVGRPKGAKAKDTEPQIRLIAALQFLGCSSTEMILFRYATEHSKYTREAAFDKFLQRHMITIERERTQMTKALACEIVKAHLPIGLAEQIVKSTR